MRSIIVLAAVCATFVPRSTYGQEAMCGPDRDLLIDQLIEYLGFDASHRDAMVSRGEIIHTGMSAGETLPEELAVAGVMLIVERPMEETVEIYLADESFTSRQGISEHGVVPEHAEGEAVRAALHDARLDPYEADEARLMANAKPGAKLNLSAEEIATLAAFNPREPALVDKVSAAYREILAHRLVEFRENGLSGIEPYARGGDKSISPSRELAAAIDSMLFLEQHFPDFVRALRHNPTTDGETGESRDFWIKKVMDGRPLFVLSHQVIVKAPTHALAGDLQFFAGHSYNSMLTVIGAVACGTNTLVVAVNHTFTDQVTGFGSSVKKQIGRKKVAEEMAGHFEVLRTSLHQRP